MSEHGRSTRLRFALVPAALALLVCLTASRAEAQPVGSCVADASDAEVSRRLAWLDARLARGAVGATAWWGGWLTYAAVEGAVAWPKYAHTHDRLDRDLWLVTALGSSLWVAQMLLFPMTPAYAPLRMRRLARATPGERRVALAKAERLLRAAAESEHENLHWAEHALDMAWAVGTAGYMLGRSYGKVPKARLWRETGIEFGLTVLITEAAILSTPRQAIRDLARYEREPCDARGGGERAEGNERARVPKPQARPWRFDLGLGSAGFTLRF